MSDDNGSKKINDELHIEEPDFVPIRRELLQLVRYWHRIELEDEWIFFLYGQCGGINLLPGARIKEISGILGDELVRKAMDDAWNEFRAKGDPRLLDLPDGLCVLCAMRKQEADDHRRWDGIELAPPPETETITEGPYKGFKIAKGERKPGLARREKCLREAEEWQKRKTRGEK